MSINKKNKLSPKGLEKIFGNDVDNLIKEIENSNKDFKKTYKTSLEIDNIIPNPYQPRKIFDETKLNELAKSIEQYGVIQPILVKQSTVNNNYYLIAGERRLRASKIAKKNQIDVIILDITDQKMHEYALIENIQRVDLNPIEESHSYHNLIKNFHINQEQLSKKVGKSAGYISNSIRLLNLPKIVQEQMLKNKLSMGHVKPFLAITEKKSLIEKIANLIIKENWNVRKVEQYIASISDRKHKKIFNEENNEINEFIQNKIIEKLGTKVTISNNKIVISYSNVNDLNRILDILNLTNN